MHNRIIVTGEQNRIGGIQRTRRTLANVRPSPQDVQHPIGPKSSEMTKTNP